MKFTIRRLFLWSLLEKAWSAGVGGSLAATKGFYFGRVGNSLTVTRMDNLLGAFVSTTAVSWKGEEGEGFLIDADKMLRLMKSLDYDEVTLSGEADGLLSINSGNFSAVWRLFDAKDYIAPSYEHEKGFTIPAKDFISAIERVRQFTSPEALSVAYKQIYMGDKLCWGSDGYNYQQIKTEIGLTETVAIPLIGLDVVRFLKLSGVPDLELSMDANFLYFAVGSDMFWCVRSTVAPPDGFVDFTSKATLDKYKCPHFTFEVSRLRQIVERVAITGSVTQKRVVFAISPGSLIVNGVDEDGNASEEKLVVTLDGEKATKTVGVHYEVFLKALASIRTPTAILFIDKKYLMLESDDSFAILPLLKK